MERTDASGGLIRGLTTLRRARAHGMLEVASHVGAARISIVEGLPVAVRMPDSRGDSLGDLLIREGALNRQAHERAFAAIPPRGPVGVWLARVGATSAPALAYVCRRQLEGRLRRLLLTEGIELHFVPGSADVGVPALQEPAPLGALLLGALRQLGKRRSLEEIAPRLSALGLTLTETGEALLEGAALWPAEQAMLVPLRAGASAEVILAAGGHSTRAMRMLWVLMEVEAVTATRGRGRAYRLLMRKRGEVRSAVGGRRLLDLPQNAGPAEARRALRKLARSLHPDRFHDAPLRSASEEVFGALLRAAAELGA